MKYTILIITLLFSGCASMGSRIQVEAFTKEPINIKCAIKALYALKSIKSVENNQFSINFKGKGFNGALYHGGVDEIYGEYGISIIKSFFNNSDIEIILESITTPIYNTCSNEV